MNLTADSRPLAHHLVGNETPPYNPVETPDGYIAEYVLGDPNPMLIQISGHRQVTGVDLATGSDFTATHPNYASRADYNRLVLERDATQHKLDRLQTLIKSGSVDNLLLRQELIMVDLLAVLNERIAAWGSV